ncbi:MAG: Hsp20/alpha crystallin family protein [Opitutales bacterium]
MRTIYEPVPFFNELDRVFSAAFPAASRLANGHSRASASAVRFDEDDNAYTLSVDLPGVTRDNVDLDVENGVLTVTAKRAYKGDNAEARTVFHRTVKLPEGADTDNASARLENGVLELTFPKEESRKPRKLAIE